MSMVQHEFKPELQFNSKLHEISKSFHQVLAVRMHLNVYNQSNQAAMHESNQTSIDI